LSKNPAAKLNIEDDGHGDIYSVAEERDKIARDAIMGMTAEGRNRQDYRGRGSHD